MIPLSYHIRCEINLNPIWILVCFAPKPRWSQVQSGRRSHLVNVIAVVIVIYTFSRRHGHHPLPEHGSVTSMLISGLVI